MNGSEPEPLRRVDVHFHVGVRGDVHPEWGGISERLRKMWPLYDIMLLYLGVKRGDDTDEKVIQRIVDVIHEAQEVDKVVCLALDHVWEEDGTARPDRSDFWTANAFVRHLRDLVPEKVLFGASVHPFRPDFRERVLECIEQGAVLLKWLPSAQQFTLAHPKARAALEFLATAKGGEPLPLLLHVGGEYAVPTTDPRTHAYDFLSWGFWDRFWNMWRSPKERWFEPDVAGIRRTLDAGLQAGATIIMAHCGLPYFMAHAELFEHDDFPVVREYLQRTAEGRTGKGWCYADVSALVTPFRRGYFDEIAKLPRELLIFGSDYPTPVFELSADLDEAWRDFKAMLDGHPERIAVPQDNIVDVHSRELAHFFPGHPMFTNFDRYLW